MKALASVPCGRAAIPLALLLFAAGCSDDTTSAPPEGVVPDFSVVDVNGVDSVVDQVLEEMTALLTSELIHAGADEETVKIADIEETAVSYMADESTRIRVKMIGDLSFGQKGGS